MRRMWYGAGAVVLALLGLVAVTSRPAPAAACPVFDNGTESGKAQSDTLVETSGLAASRRSPGVLWAHNDGGDYELHNLEAMTPAGRQLATYHVTNGVGEDWEAMTRGRIDGTDYLYVVNNDNPDEPDDGYETVTIHRIAEPAVSPDQSPVEEDITADRVHTVRFPSGQRHYVETLMFDPKTGDLLLGTKNPDSGEVVILRYPAPHDSDATLTKVTTVTLPAVDGDDKSRAASDGTISDDGTEVVIRTSGAGQRAYLWQWDRSGGQSLADALAGTRCGVPLPDQEKGETIAFAPDRGTYYTVGEGEQQPIWSFAPQRQSGSPQPSGSPSPSGSQAPSGSPSPSKSPGDCENPADVLDLENWKIQLPVDDPDKPDKQPKEVKQPELATYEIDPWFTPTESCDGVRFRAAVNGVTTSGSKNPRSELREMNGSEEAAWSAGSGTHTLTVTESFDALPKGKPHLVGAQIHDSSDDVTVFRLEGSKLYVTNGDDPHHKLVTDTYELGTKFEAKFVVEDGKVTAYYNGEPQATIDADFEGGYFKAGAYTQANCSNSEPCDENNYGETTIYKLTVSHT